jgi:hypothetical protein
MMLGALKGIILDGDGDVLYDLFKEFGIQKTVIEFKLSDPKFNVKKPAWMYAVTLKRTCWVMSLPVSGLCRCRLHGCTHHPPECGKGIPGLGRCPREYRRRRAWRLQVRRRDFEEYTGEVPKADGKSTVSLISAGTGHAYPQGTRQTFLMYDAPGDFMEAVGTLGQPYYAKIKNTDFDRGVDVHTQSNPLPLCARPGALVELKLT